MVRTIPVSEMNPVKFTPKMKRHFIFAIEGIDMFLVKTAQRPTFATEEVEIPWINQTRFIAGKTKPNAITVTLHSAIAPSAEQQVMEWHRLCHESVSGRDGYPDFYKRDIQIKILDPVGSIVELWDIKGAFITEANFGDLSHEAGAEMLEISLTIRFDNSVLQF